MIFNEPKALLTMKGPVPVGEHFVPFGKASIARQGTDVTVVSCGLLVHRCLEAADELAAESISCEVIDLRTIVPLDVETIVASVSKTGHLLIVDEAYAMCGIGAEVSAAVMEEAFDCLDAPVGRLHTDPVPQPFSPPLEQVVTVGRAKIAASIKAVLAGRPPVPRRIPEPSSRVPTPVTPPPRPAERATPPPAPAPAERAKPPLAPAREEGVPLTMPRQDMILEEVEVVKWLKDVGDPVAAGEAVVEIETDKAAVEIESPAGGVLAEILAPVGSVVALGEQMGTIRPDGAAKKKGK